mmetsp:Transcript_19691/g.66192  ORF Transcript_19691/g.66192 Transcript_19691/m.66192 type:complete len:204 (+) Transcript_19691:806-1417(+)
MGGHAGHLQQRDEELRGLLGPRLRCPGKWLTVGTGGCSDRGGQDAALPCRQRAQGHRVGGALPPGPAAHSGRAAAASRGPKTRPPGRQRGLPEVGRDRGEGRGALVPRDERVDREQHARPGVPRGLGSHGREATLRGVRRQRDGAGAVQPGVFQGAPLQALAQRQGRPDKLLALMRAARVPGEMAVHLLPPAGLSLGVSTGTP